MKMWRIGLLLGFFLSAAGDSAAPAAPPAAQKPIWHTDYERAREIARQQGKPLLVVFR